MAVSFKTDTSYGVKLLALFGVDPALTAKANLVGIVVDQKTPGSFSVRTKAGELVATVSVKGQAISLAKSGSLGPASKQSIRYEFEAALKKAIKASTGVEYDPVQNSGVSITPSPDIKAVVDALVDFPEESNGNVVSATIKKIPKPASNGPVKLEEATALYQEVTGTSSLSIYRVVALLNGAALAVQIKPSMLSFRLAGPSYKHYQSCLKDLGFSIKDSYASAHYSITDNSLRKKTLGAICGAIGFTNFISLGCLENVK